MKNNTYKQTEIGEIPEDWNIQTLIEMSEFITDGSHWSPKPYHGITNYKIATVKDMQENGFNLDTCKSISPDDFSKLLNQKCVPQKGDVAIAKDGSYLKHVFVISKDQDIALLSSIAIIRTNANKLLPLYLKYYLKTDSVDRRVKENYVSGAVIPRIILKDFEKIKIAKPSVSEQQQIASVLSSLDDKIELNRRMNKTLEEIGKALFKRWFVDFEFPNENGEPYKSSGGEMVDSELGEIPKGWKVDSLGNFSEIHNGFAFKSEDYQEDGIVLVRTRDFSGEGYVYVENPVYLPENFYESYSKYQLNKFDILLVMVGASVGKRSFVTSSSLPALQNQNMWNFRAKDKGQLFLKYLLDRLVEKNIGSASGSAREFFRKDHFRMIRFVLPQIELLLAFEDSVESIYNQIDLNISKNGSLKKTRDSLLPRLMSGKIRVN